MKTPHTHHLAVTHLVPGTLAHIQHILERKHGAVQVLYRAGGDVYYWCKDGMVEL